tara:strand:- start:1934 stop:2230 length:297 start_codon:yes stop_codon:yes gene_type:complete
MAAPVHAWEQLHALTVINTSGGFSNGGFDRSPGLFSFHPPNLSFTIHVIACHNSTGEFIKTEYQNMLEGLYLQHICCEVIFRKGRSPPPFAAILIAST